MLAWRLALLASVSLVAVGSLVPSQLVPAHPLKDKLLHFVGYGIVSGLAMIAIRSPRRQIIGLAMLTALGIALEFGQIFVPGRAFEVADMAANGMGVFLAFQACRLLFS